MPLTPTDEIIELKKLHVKLTELERFEQRKKQLFGLLQEKKAGVKECVYPPYNPPVLSYDPEPAAPQKKRGFNQSGFERITFLIFSLLILAGVGAVLYVWFLTDKGNNLFKFIDRYKYFILGGLAALGLLFFLVRIAKHGIKFSRIKRNHDRLVNRYRDYVKTSSGETLSEYEKSYKRQCDAIKDEHDKETAEYLNASDEINAELIRIEDKLSPLQAEIEVCQLFSNRLKNLEDTAGILSMFEDGRADTLKEAINLYVAEKRDSEHRRLILEEQIRLSKAMEKSAASAEETRDIIIKEQEAAARLAEQQAELAEKQMFLAEMQAANAERAANDTRRLRQIEEEREKEKKK